MGGESFVVGDVRLDVLSPHACYTGTESDTNNDALVLRLTHREDSVLFATEPEEPAQEWLLEQREQAGLDLHADVLKVPHHGAATSVGEFFDAVAAPIAVVSVGENTYGHPTPFTLDALAEAGSTVWRTDEHGTVTATFVDGEAVLSSGALSGSSAGCVVAARHHPGMPTRPRASIALLWGRTTSCCARRRSPGSGRCARPRSTPGNGRG